MSGYGSKNVLSEEEEWDLCDRVRQGDEEAKDQLVQAHAHIAVHVARKHAGKGVDVHDLIQEGMIGLGKAVEEFDPAYGRRFEVYAPYWVRQAVRICLRKQGTTIRVSAVTTNRLRKWQHAERQLREANGGRNPTEEEVQQIVGLTDAQVRDVGRAKAALRPMGGDAAEAILTEPQGDPVDHAEMLFLYEEIKKLTEVEQRVIVLRYGFGLDRPMKLREVGCMIGKTPARVGQIQAAAELKLKKAAAAMCGRKQTEGVRSGPDATVR